MFRNNLFTILLFSSLCAGVTTASAEVIFSDSFESGDMSASNADGFAWDKNNRTSVVTQDLKDGPVGIYNNKLIYNIHDAIMPDGSTRDWTARDGKNSLKFRYAAGEEWTEQRFDFGKGYPEIWVSYHIRVPLNYHRGPDGPAGGRNNKWLVILMSNMSGYSNSNITMFANLDRPPYDVDESAMKMSSSIKIGNDRGWTTETRGYVDFVTTADAGRWMEVIYHLRANSAEGVDDGVYKMYRKWDDERATFTLIDSIDPAPMPISKASIDMGYNGWGGGYLMGYANDPYAEDTEWLIDNIIIANTSLLPNPTKPPTSVKGEVIK